MSASYIAVCSNLVLSQKQKASVNLVNLVSGKLLVEEPQMQPRKVTYIQDGFMVRG